MTIFKQELRANLKNTIMWICVLNGIMILFMSFYPTISSDIDNFMKLMENFPPEMKAVFGIATQNFASAIGFYSFVFVYISLFAAIQAMNLGIGIVSKESRERTADFLMTKPVSRIKILTSKILAVFTLLIITNVIYSTFSSLMVSGFSEQGFEVKKFILINASMFFTQLIFFSIGLIVSIALKKVRSVLSISLGLVFMFYAISSFAVTSKDDKLRFITPFQYFKTDYILTQSQYESMYAIIGIFIVVISIIISYILYKRKDIHAT